MPLHTLSHRRLPLRRLLLKQTSLKRLSLTRLLQQHACHSYCGRHVPEAIQDVALEEVATQGVATQELAAGAIASTPGDTVGKTVSGEGQVAKGKDEMHEGHLGNLLIGRLLRRSSCT